MPGIYLRSGSLCVELPSPPPTRGYTSPCPYSADHPSTPRVRGDRPGGPFVINRKKRFPRVRGDRPTLTTLINIFSRLPCMRGDRPGLIFSSDLLEAFPPCARG